MARKEPIKYKTDKVLHKNNDTYHYKNGSLTPLYNDPTYDSNVQIKIGSISYELAYGRANVYPHVDFHDFVSDFVDKDTGRIRAKKYYGTPYYLKAGNNQYPVRIDKKTMALMVEINGEKYDMNDLMSGKVKIN